MRARRCFEQLSVSFRRDRVPLLRSARALSAGAADPGAWRRHEALDALVGAVSADCGFAQVRTGRKRCAGPYVVPPETRPPEVPRHCPLEKVKKWI